MKAQLSRRIEELEAHFQEACAFAKLHEKKDARRLSSQG